MSFEEAKIAADNLRRIKKYLIEKGNRKQANKIKVVGTSGCFDIIHIVHIEFLERCSRMGALFVGLNSDESIRRLKGKERPIIPLEHRQKIIAALRYVDYVVPYSELRPFEFIKAIKPDIWVKGGDYDLKTLPERKLVEGLGGKVIILPKLGDVSTTRIITEIRNGKTLAN